VSPHYWNKVGVKFRCSGICVAKALEPSGSSYAPYALQTCVERLIAAVRPALAAFSLLALWLDLSEPTRYAHIAAIVLAGYGGYGLLVALLVWRAKASRVGLHYGPRAAGVLISTALMYFTERPTRPFFLPVICVQLCAMFYWQWRGIVWTAMAALIVCLGLGGYAVGRLHEAAFVLHTFIQALQPSSAALAETSFALAPHLERLGQRLERLWSLAVDMHLEVLDRALPGTLSQGLYLMIHEALINATRHLGASSVCVELSVQDMSGYLMGHNNGRGFPLHGHYHLAALMALSLGPRMLRERVASLGGDLTIDSTAAEPCLFIAVPPLGRSGAQECQFAS
jgi:hypothetical protein